MNRKGFIKPEREELNRLYNDENKTMKEIAELLGIAVGTVYNYCKAYQIPTRKQEDVFTAKGKKWSNESRKKLSEARKGFKHTEESKRKLSESHKKGGIGKKKRRSDGYISIYFPDHPRATKDGYIMEHVLVMECLIGRHLNPGEVVHHINFKKDDNRKENLMLMTASEHMRYHMTIRNKKER